MSSVHLLCLIHGMWGNPQHLSELDRIFRETHEKEGGDIEFKVLLAQTNRDESTYDGIDWGGERVAKEVLDEVEKLNLQGKQVTRFSVTGYSLGGLLARYVIGILQQRNFFKDITPVNFNTFATPHIGVLRYPSVLSSIMAYLGPQLLSRTGEQFYCTDKWSTTGRPLLEVMADPELVFHQALALFPNIRIYANAINDTTVPYVTAAFTSVDPFGDHLKNGIEIELDEQYSPLIKSWHLPSVPPAPTPKPKPFSAAWFKRSKFSKPLLPHFLQFRFPLNIVLFISLPILIPTFISVAILRLSLAARSSRARIKLLESDESYSQRLAHVLAQLEKQVEEAVVDLIEDPSYNSDSSTSESAPLDITKSRKDTPKGTFFSQRRSKQPRAPQEPLLSPAQLKIISWLNSIPNIQIERAFIWNIKNSHATIVSRDVKRFKIHRQGEGVIRHWADTFVL